eukprot:750989-Hanusia_phi.AAC.3
MLQVVVGEEQESDSSNEESGDNEFFDAIVMLAWCSLDCLRCMTGCPVCLEVKLSSWSNSNLEGRIQVQGCPVACWRRLAAITSYSIRDAATLVLPASSPPPEISCGHCQNTTPIHRHLCSFCCQMQPVALQIA